MQDSMKSVLMGLDKGLNHAVVPSFASIFESKIHCGYPSQIKKFFKERKWYKLKIICKRVELPTIHAAPYKATINRRHLKYLHMWAGSRR